MTDVSRRALLGVAAATAATSVALPAAAAGRTTIIVSPHPDDEVLRGAGYANYATHRGDRMILVAMTDGGATSMGSRFYLSRSQVEHRRRNEQELAWSMLTHGKGEVIRMGLPDGAVTYDAALAAMQRIVAQYPGAEIYVAAHPWDGSASPDHIPIWQACRDSGATVVRYLKDPTYSGGATGTVYPVDVNAAKDSVTSYVWTLGRSSSVRSIRDALIASGYRSRYTRY